MKRTTVALLLLVLGLVAGCGASNVNTQPDKSAAKGGSDSSSAKVGQPITIKGSADGSQLQVTVIKVVKTRPTDQFSKVDKGQGLIAVQFKMVNTGTTAYNDAPSNGAVVVDARGQQYDGDAGILFQKVSAGVLLPTLVKLAPNNKALGYLVFQVPLKAHIRQIQFAMDSGFGDTAQWNV